MSMKCVVVGDTHQSHRQVEIPDGDVFIHVGDFCNIGSLKELDYFLMWLYELPHKHKVIIAGNHDWCLQDEAREAALESIKAHGITYLEDSSVEIEGIKFYGSPWQPWFFDWAFNLRTPEELREKWDMIPDDTDILITHGPSFGRLDRVIEGEHVGCAELHKAILRVNPKFHLCGHIHEGYGQETVGDTTYINASINTRRYDPTNLPITFEI